MADSLGKNQSPKHFQRNDHNEALPLVDGIDIAQYDDHKQNYHIYGIHIVCNFWHAQHLPKTIERIVHNGDRRYYVHIEHNHPFVDDKHL